MMKMIALASSLFLSMNVYANTPDLASNLNKAIAKQNAKSPTQDSTIVYGGKDISRSIIATANESVWTKQGSNVG